MTVKNSEKNNTIDGIKSFNIIESVVNLLIVYDWIASK